MKIPRINLGQNLKTLAKTKKSVKNIENLVPRKNCEVQKTVSMIPEFMKKSKSTGLTTPQLIDLILMNL